MRRKPGRPAADPAVHRGEREIIARELEIRTTRLTTGVQHQRRKQNQSGIAVRLEKPQAERGIADVEARDLPAQMGRERRKAERENDPGAGRPSRQPDQHHGRG